MGGFPGPGKETVCRSTSAASRTAVEWTRRVESNHLPAGLRPAPSAGRRMASAWNTGSRRSDSDLLIDHRRSWPLDDGSGKKTADRLGRRPGFKPVTHQPIAWVRSDWGTTGFEADHWSECGALLQQSERKGLGPHLAAPVTSRGGGPPRATSTTLWNFQEPPETRRPRRGTAGVFRRIVRGSRQIIRVVPAGRNGGWCDHPGRLVQHSRVSAMAGICDRNTTTATRPSSSVWASSGCDGWWRVTWFAGGRAGRWWTAWARRCSNGGVLCSGVNSAFGHMG
jgi:hypothetical protein